MAASITIAHGHAHRDLPVRVPHLMPFHIQHTGPAPISTYFRIRPHIGTSLPTSTPETTQPPPSGDTEKEPITPAATTEVAVEEKENALVAAVNVAVPVPATVVAEADVVPAKAPTPASRVPRTGTICYCLDKRLNCLVVGATPPGFAVCMTCVSYMSHASARGLVSGHRLNWSVLLRYPNLVSG
jgi:hypothetical protein